jgi:ribosomal protein S18 acetylase RimI-like enzyme
MNLVDWRQEMETATVDLLARAFAGNPLHVAAFGTGSVVEKNKAFFRTALSMFPGRRLVAVDGSKILGFMHWVESPGCRLLLDERVRLAPVMLREFGLGATLRVSTWLSAWAKSDPAEAHWHFGPIGVDPDAQGRGIGRRMLDVYCAELDDTAAVGFLETDKPENVRFYQKFSFEVVKEIKVIGVSTYLMTRKGKPTGGG